MLVPTLVSAALVASAYASLQAPTKHTPFSDLYRRQVADTTYSDDAFVLRIIDSVTDECLPVCRTFADRVELCITRGGSDLDMARCSCDGPSLARMETCASCIENDPTAKSESTPLADYNGFASLCVGVDLARATAIIDASGTFPTQTSVEASASTSTPAETGARADQTLAATNEQAAVAATTLVTSGAGMSKAGGLGAVAIVAMLVVA